MGFKEKKDEYLNQIEEKLNRIFNKYTISAIFFIVVILLNLPKSSTTTYNLQIGDIAPKTIRATVNMLVEDKEATKHRIEEAMNNVPPVFDYNSQLFSNTVSLLKKALFSINKDNPETSEKAFFTMLKIKPNPSLYKRIIRFSPQEIFDPAKDALESLQNYYIVNSVRSLYKFSPDKIMIRDIKNPKEEQLLNKDDVIDVTRAKIIAYNRLRDTVDNVILRNTIWDLISQLISPNLTFNSLATQQKKEEAAKKVNKVFFKISKGEIIVRSGDVITKADYLKLNALNSLTQKQNTYVKFIANMLIFIIISIVLFKVYETTKPKRING